MAITDHDTMSGIDEAAAAAKGQLDFLSGVEISSCFSGFELHVVGLGVRSDCPPLNEALHDLQQQRLDRAREIIRRLNDLGVPVDLDKILERVNPSALGRIHIAQEVMALGNVRQVQDAFDRFIGKNGPAFVSKKNIPCEKAVDLIHQAGGLAFVGHPGIGVTVHRKLDKILMLPFDGIEAYHSKHMSGQVAAFLELAKKRGLLVAGGSDCHGTAKTKADMGSVRVPVECYERIVEALSSR